MVTSPRALSGGHAWHVRRDLRLRFTREGAMDDDDRTWITALYAGVRAAVRRRHAWR